MAPIGLKSRRCYQQVRSTSPSCHFLHTSHAKSPFSEKPVWAREREARRWLRRASVVLHVCKYISCCGFLLCPRSESAASAFQFRTQLRARLVKVKMLFNVVVIRVSVRISSVVRVPLRDTISWNTSISAYRMNRKISESMMYERSVLRFSLWRARLMQLVWLSLVRVVRVIIARQHMLMISIRVGGAPHQ